MSKIINTRISQKHDFECNWDSESTSIIPLSGEVIIYDSEVNENGDTVATLPSGRTNPYSYARVKIGDGIHHPKDLPFVDDAVRELLKDKHEIIDVVELPTENIQEDATYRVLSGTFVSEGVLRNDSTCHVVNWENGPTGEGEPVITVNNEEFSYTGYYNIVDNTVYGCLNDATISTLKTWVSESNLNEIQKAAILLYLNTLQPGWETIDNIVSKLGSNLVLSWGGVVTSKELMTGDSALYLYLNSDMFFYHNNSWVSSDTLVGLKGSGIGAEIFNNLNNVASGKASHAEGSFTSATEDSAHAEGYGSAASGKASHAEGDQTVATHPAAHAEGSGTQAININSHAEGSNTVAEGPHSHAEGYETNASGSSAHAEGLNTASSGEFSHAEGMKTIADAVAAHAEGTFTYASGAHSHAEGYKTTAQGSASHAGGLGTFAAGDYQTAIGRYNATDDSSAFIIGNGASDGTNTIRTNALSVDWEGNAKFSGDITSKGRKVLTTSDYITAGRKAETAVGGASTAEGAQTTASGIGSHAEGGETSAEGPWAHSEGYGSKASGNSSHAEGLNNIASADYSHAEGQKTVASGIQSHAEGQGTTARGASSHAEGDGSNAFGSYSHAEGYQTTASNTSAHAEGNSTTASGAGSHAEGDSTTAEGVGSHAEGFQTYAKGSHSHAEGVSTNAIGDNSHAEGGATNASGDYSHAEGWSTTASADCAHAEGQGTTASDAYSHAEGVYTTASGAGSHAEGLRTTASGHYSHAEGEYTTASGNDSHAEGVYTTASGQDSHAEGYYTIAQGNYQHVSGKYNVGDTTSVVIIGNGTTAKNPETGETIESRSNAHTLDWDGNAWYSGDVKIGGDGYSDENAKTLATQEYVDKKIYALDKPQVAGNGLTFIQTISETDGIIDATKGEIQDGTTEQKGVVQLSDESSDDTTTAATPNAIKKAIEDLEGMLVDLSAVDTAIKFVSNVQQTNGKVTAEVKSVPLGTKTTYGIVQLTNDVDNSQLYAVTPKGVKDAITAAIGTLDSTSPTTSEELVSVEFIDSVSQTDGKVEATKKRIRSASLSEDGIVQLYDNLDSTSTSLAATANAVKTAYDTACSTHYITTGRKEGTTEGARSTAEGFNTTASGSYSHAEGVYTTAGGMAAHAEGSGTTASNLYAHAEGGGTTASGSNSHAEGIYVVAMGNYSHAEGQGSNSIPESITTQSTTDEILNTWSTTKFSLARGTGSHVEGTDCLALGTNAHAEGHACIAQGDYSHAEGYNTTAEGDYSHASGYNTAAKGNYQTVIGRFNTKDDTKAFIIGAGGIVSGAVIPYNVFTVDWQGSVASGRNTTASGSNSHAEGWGTTASGSAAHAEGGYTTALGAYSHAEGKGYTPVPNTITTQSTNEAILNAWATTKFSLAKGTSSHVEGTDCLALGNSSHAEGYACSAQGDYSHAEGEQTSAIAIASHASGTHTQAGSAYQTVIGKYNILDVAGQYAFIIGNGSDLPTDGPSNALTVDWDGNLVVKGNISAQAGSTKIDLVAKIKSLEMSLQTAQVQITAMGSRIAALEEKIK